VVAIFGTRFSDVAISVAETVPLPNELGGASVTFNNQPAPLYAVLPTQIVAQLPWNLDVSEGQRASIVVSNDKGVSEARDVVVSLFSPAIYTVTQNGSGQGVVVFANSQDLVAPVGFSGASRPAKAGDVIAVYANGLGSVEPPVGDGLNSCDPDGTCLPGFSNLVLRRTSVRPTVLVGGVEIADEDILFSGLAPEFVSLYVIHVRVGADVPSGDQVPVVIRMNALDSRSDVTIAVE